MIVSEFLRILTGHNKEFLYDEFPDRLLVEMPDETYRDVKEVFWLPREKIALRLDDIVITEAEVQGRPAPTTTHTG